MFSPFHIVETPLSHIVAVFDGAESLLAQLTRIFRLPFLLKTLKPNPVGG
jgi:hypothetical protein